MNNTHCDVLNGLIQVARDFLESQPNPAQLLNLVLNYDSNNVAHINILTNSTGHIRDMLANLRSLAVGAKISLRHANGAFSFEQNNSIIPYNLLHLGTITRTELSDHVRQSLNSLHAQFNHVTPLVQQVIAQSENLVNDVVAENDSSTWEDTLRKIIFGTGRGGYNFIMRFIFPFLHPIQTLNGLKTFIVQLFTDPVTLFKAMKTRLVNYATDDPIAFTTDLFLNIAALAVAIAAVPNAAPAAPVSPIVVSRIVGGGGAVSTTAATVPLTTANFGFVSPVVGVATPPSLATSTAATVVTATTVSTLTEITTDSLENNNSEKAEKMISSKSKLLEYVKDGLASSDYIAAKKMFITQLTKALMSTPKEKQTNIVTAKSDFHLDLFAPVDIIGEEKKAPFHISLFQPVEVIRDGNNQVHSFNKTSSISSTETKARKNVNFFPKSIPSQTNTKSLALEASSSIEVPKRGAVPIVTSKLALKNN